MITIRFRGVYLAVMAVPLFLSVTLILFLKVDILTREVSASELYNDVSYVNHVVMMQQALKSLNNFNTANDMPKANILPFDCRQMNAIKMQPISSSANSDNPIIRRTGNYGLTEVKVVQSIAQNIKNDKLPEGTYVILANYQILKEAVTLLQLSHPALARVLGICSSIDQDDAMYIAETGPPVNITYLKTLKFTKRLQIVYHVVSLLGHLHNSSLGHLSLRSVNKNTFLWIDGLVKLADISQLTMDNIACTRHSDCLLEGSNTGVKCQEGVCVGLQNQVILRQTLNFLRILLQGKDRKTELDRIDHIISQIDHLNIDAAEAARQIKDLLDMMTLQKLQGKTVKNDSKGKNKWNSDLENWQTKDTLYWPGGPDEYKFQRKVNMTITSGHYDYACPRSLISWGCQLRVNTITQALTHCTGDPQCRAFVLTQNEHQVGTLTVVLKSGDGEMHMKAGSFVYVKVPLGRDSFHMSHEDDNHANYQSENPALCFPGITSSWKKDRENRHASMMKLTNMHALTEAEWLEDVTSSTITSITLLQDEMTHKHGGLRLLAKMDGISKLSVILNNSGKPSNSHLSHLLFYHLDRLLGLYRVVPTAVRSLNTQELEMITNIQPKLKTKLENALQGNTSVYVVITPNLEGQSISTKPLSIRPLSQFPTKVVSLSSNERRQLEYLTLLWLSGTPRDQTYTSVNGESLHLLNMDGFQQGVDNLLPYFNLCQFPKSLAEFLQSLTNNTNDSCTVSSLLLYRLKQDGFQDRDILSGFHSVNHLMLLIDKAVEKLLETIKKCFEVFGKDAVLY